MIGAARKGLILAGGLGSRLYPATHVVSKQLLPVYDKPMIYYALSTLMMTGIRDVAIISRPDDLPRFRALLGEGQKWGMTFSYIAQGSPDGIAQAYCLAAEYLDGAPSALVLGDNLFFGAGLSEKLRAANARGAPATVFAHSVDDPSRYGVVEFNAQQEVVNIIEKPARPASTYALTGIYFLDGHAPDLAADLIPSARGEFEITDLLAKYLREGNLLVEKLGPEFAWFDTGTHESLMAASELVRSIEQTQKLKIGCPEEIAYRNGWISTGDLVRLAQPYSGTNYGKYLSKIALES